MEGVGARLGRSSTRYGPATVFNGPVRKWKKKWVHVSPSSNNSLPHHNHNATSTTNGNNGSHLKLYKWTPIAQSNNATTDDNDSTKDDVLVEEPPRRRFKYIPIAALEEPKHENESADKVEEEEAKPNDIELSEMEPPPKSNAMEEKPDINDVPMDDNEAVDNNQLVRQDLNESTLDLSLGWKAHDGDGESDQTRDGQ